MLETTLNTAASSAHSALVNTPLHGILASLEAGIRHTGTAARHMDEAQTALFEIFLERFDSPVVAKVMTLKVLNLWLAKHHLQARSAHVGSRPFAMYIDPSNSCNLGCPGCVHSTTSKE